MSTVLIDLIGTFFSVEPVRQRLTALGAPEHALDLWFAEAARDSMALTLAGTPAPLLDTLAATLPRTLATIGKCSQDPARHEVVMKGFHVLNPVEGAAEALDRLARSGHRVLAITSGSEEHARSLLDRSGLLGRFGGILAAHSSGAAKPHPHAYAQARMATEGDGWYLSAHAWDVIAAQRAGFHAAWISKKEKRWPATFPAPNLEAPDLPTCSRILESAALGHAAAQA